MQTQPSDVMTRLREETSEHHRNAEQNPFEQQMVRGTLPRELYAQGLVQRWRIHHELEGHLGVLRKTDSRIANVVSDEQLQAANAEHDLRYYNAGNGVLAAEVPATGRAVKFLAAHASEKPIALLGVLYVLEGSKNGSKYIARSVSRAYSVSGPEGLRYLDPHGEQQKPVWEAFKQRMNAATFSTAEVDAMVAAAKATFDFIGEVDTEVIGGGAATAAAR